MLRCSKCNNKALEKCSQDESLAIVLIDLDQLKPINDQLGHSIGDEVLRQVADRLQKVTGDMGFVGRLGGDEYALVAERLANAQQAVTVARAIHQAFQLPFEIKAQDSNIAEGVENLQQYETIKQWGFDKVQGVFIGNAIQPDDIPALVKRNTSIFSNKRHTAANAKLTHLTRVGFATLHESMLDLDSLTMDVLDVER